MNLTTHLCGLTLAHPIIAAPGPWSATLGGVMALADGGAAAVTLKTVASEYRQGHPAPNFVTWEHGAINAIGLPSPDLEAWQAEMWDAWFALDSIGVPDIASIYGETTAEFIVLARRINQSAPAMLELNASCPNLNRNQDELDSIAECTADVKAVVTCPVSVKLSPATPDIGRVARACEEAGADAITAVNTMPAMLIDAETGRPTLSNGTGGMSGPALKPIALRCVYEIAKAVRIPIIGVGGVTTGLDAVEMLMAGATVVGVGTAIHTHGPGVLGRIASDLREWMITLNYASVEHIRGLAHKSTTPG